MNNRIHDALLNVPGTTLIRQNAEADKNYAPYCLGCRTMERMAIIERFLWRCRHCGTVHDARDKTP